MPDHSAPDTAAPPPDPHAAAWANPALALDYEARNCSIVSHTGQAIFAMDRAMMPPAWSQQACNILAQKYFRHAGVPSATVPMPPRDDLEAAMPEWLRPRQPTPDATYGGETHASQVFTRLAGCWTYWGWRCGLIKDEEAALSFYRELVIDLYEQRAAPNSPQWFNTGLFWAYGLDRPGQGHYYVTEQGELALSRSAYERPQPSACFIQSVSDDLVNTGGIMDLWVREARLFKYGSGTGTNFSALRADGERLSGGGRSSGLMSFLKIGDRAAGAIKSGGTTRRAAKMVILDVDHPDIVNFIDWKVKEEHKVAALVAGSKTIKRFLGQLEAAYRADGDKAGTKTKKLIRGMRTWNVPEGTIQQALALLQAKQPLDFDSFDTDWQSAAYETVSGQNSNNSVRVSDAFMRAVQDGAPWALVRRTDQQPAGYIPAADLMDKIVRAAWASADPGIQFDTTINDWHTCPESGRINASNPCSEYMFLDDTACNLASINLIKFRNPISLFDTDDFVDTVDRWTLVLEISVAMGQFPSAEIAQRTFDFRTLGLGYANLGALLMSLGLSYDSDKGRSLAGALTALMTANAYRCSAEMAEQLGPFPRYAENAPHMLRVIEKHYGAAIQASQQERNGLQTIWRLAIDQWTEALERGRRHGYRNAQVTVLAPTGTIGLVMDCDTTGIEPDFSLVKHKELAGGGSMRIVNQTVPLALATLGYESSATDAIVAHLVGHATLRGAPHINPETLRAKKIGQQSIDAIEAALPRSFSIGFAFNPSTVAEWDTLTADVENKAQINLLKHLGYTDAQIAEANAYVCGHGTIEGAPHLDDAHLPIFDCANPTGSGIRFLTADAHIDMMAAAQPFLSGAISKTVNMPATASIDDVRRVYFRAWRKQLKAVAIYRANSKLSQPLMSALLGLDDEPDELMTEITLEGAAQLIAASTVARTEKVETNSLTGAPRRKLPYYVPGGYRQKVYINGQKIFLRATPADDGSLGEIFIDCYREGTTMRALMNSFCIAISIGLQYGVPLEKFVELFVFSRFEPAGMVQGHDYIKKADSILDYLFRDLAIRWLGRTDLAHVKPPENDDNPELKRVVATTVPVFTPTIRPGPTTLRAEAISGEPDAAQKARSFGYEGYPCTTCGQFQLVRRGTCLYCDNCSESSGGCS